MGFIYSFAVPSEKELSLNTDIRVRREVDDINCDQ